MKIFSLILMLSLPLLCAGQVTLLVGPGSSSEAYLYAESQANGNSIKAFKSFHTAMTEAAALLTAGKSHVTIKVAGGEYDGKAGSGTWSLPIVKNAGGKLHLLGGYSNDFSTRNPFQYPVWLKSRYGRGDAFIALGNKSELNELIISGFVMDAAPSNNYDAGTNSLKKHGSCTYPLIRFNYLKADHLVIADNVLINGAQAAFDPYIYAGSSNTVIDISNNFIMNNVMAIQQLGAINAVKQINFSHNSVISNWPYNPDPTSSNVSAIGLYHKGGAGKVVIDGNLFAYNVGGAFQHDWTEDRMPVMEFTDNLFYDNAKLFGKSPEYGVIAGKFGANPRYMLLDIETMEEDFGYKFTGNVSRDPGLQVEQFFSFEMQEDDGWAEIIIDSYAPPMTFNPDELPIPYDPENAPYGVQVKNCWPIK